MTVLLWFYSVFGIFFCQSVFGKEEGECYRTVWSEDLKKNVIDYYCCDDYMRINGTCIECEKGYTSIEGRQCQPCPNDSYGIRCIQSCLCTEIQRCDHVIGCMNLSFTTDRVTKEDLSTSVTVITKIYETKKKEDDQQNNGIFSQKIVVYTTCISGLLVVITICYVCAKRLQNDRTIHRPIESNHWNRDHENSRFVQRDLPNPVFCNRENEAEFENMYEEIDETNIKETTAPFVHVYTTDEPAAECSESENEENLEDDDYLNPYQPMVNDPDSHDYNTAISNTEQSMKIKFRNKQELGIETNYNKSLCSDRLNLENVDHTLMNCSNKCVITNAVNAVNALQLEISKSKEYSGVQDVLNLKNNSTSMDLLSSRTIAFKENSSMLSLKRRVSI